MKDGPPAETYRPSRELKLLRDVAEVIEATDREFVQNRSAKAGIGSGEGFDVYPYLHKAWKGLEELSGGLMYLWHLRSTQLDVRDRDLGLVHNILGGWWRIQEAFDPEPLPSSSLDTPINDMTASQLLAVMHREFPADAFNVFKADLIAANEANTYLDPDFVDPNSYPNLLVDWLNTCQCPPMFRDPDPNCSVHIVTAAKSRLSAMVKETWSKLGATLSDPEAYEYLADRTYLDELPLRIDNSH